MIIYIYNNKLKFITGVIVDKIEDFKKEPKKHYPDWKETYYYSEVLLENPILIDGELKEKEKEVVDTITKEYLVEQRKNKIVEYEKLEEEKKLLEGSKFSSEDEIKIIIEKMTVLEGDINNLQEKIKLL